MRIVDVDEVISVGRADLRGAADLTMVRSELGTAYEYLATEDHIMYNPI